MEQNTQQTPITILPSGSEQGQPGRSAVEIATEQARSRLTESGTAAPPAPKERHPGTGQFIEKGRVDTARELGTPRAGQGSQTADPAAGEGGEGGEGSEAADGQAGAETEEQRQAREAAEAAGDGGEGEQTEETDEEREAREAADRTVVFTGRNDQEFELVLPADTPQDVIEAVRSLRNSTMRAEEIRTAREEVSRRAEQLEQREAEIEMDPVGFLLEGVGTEQPELVEHTVLYLLTQPKVWAKLQPQVQALLDDERELRTVRAEQGERRHAIREELRTAAEERTIVSRNLQEVQATVGAILPTDWSADRQRVLWADCMRDLKDYAERHNLLTIQPKDIPAILSHRLTAYGINPAEAATRAAELAARGTAAARRPAAGPAKRTPAPTPSAQTPPNGKRFVVAAQKKAAAAAIPPGGAGSPAGVTALTPPAKSDGSKMGIQETIDWHRKRLGNTRRK